MMVRRLDPWRIPFGARSLIKGRDVAWETSRGYFQTLYAKMAQFSGFFGCWGKFLPCALLAVQCRRPCPSVESGANSGCDGAGDKKKNNNKKYHCNRNHIANSNKIMMKKKKKKKKKIIMMMMMMMKMKQSPEGRRRERGRKGKTRRE